jgi:CelD/BcsL family acetyltransferase involved in cellulose biosynthesis
VLRKFVTALADTARLQSFERAPFVDTSKGWASYKNGLGRSMRRNVEYYARRLFKRYDCRFERVGTFNDLIVALDALIALHVTQWQSRGEIGSLANPSFQRFFREAARSSFVDGRLRVWTLRINGRIEAVLLGFVDAGVVHYFQKGHNPAFAKEDLGTALVSLCIRDCCDDPAIRIFDFMGGGADYKQMWARQAREIVLGEMNRSNVRARAFALHDRLRTSATAVYRAIVPMSLRAMRRDWLKARSIREQLRRATHPIAGAVAALSTFGADTIDLVAIVDVVVLASLLLG